MLSAAMTAYAELVAELLVNECDRPPPARVLRYFGHGVPDDLGCDDAGTLSVWWEPIATAGGRTPCPGVLTAPLTARYMICWPKATGKNATTTAADLDTWDGVAATMSDVAECVARGLQRLVCQPIGEDEFGGKLKALADLMIRPSVGFVQASPIGPAGQLVGVEWDISIGLRAAPPEES